MPRTAGVSGRVEVRCSLLSLRPISVWRCLASRRIGEPVCSTVTVAEVSLAMPASSRFRAGFAAAIATTGLQGRDLQAATGRDRTRAVLALQSVECGAHQVVGV